ncbi:hypothetical protein QE152_g31162 [Popillia japonica]|uniref:Uncharacterized protein n=1 Tax=Popillia japonica TaxID=7064 RepID=A0AAW1JCC7_POPJA
MQTERTFEQGVHEIQRYRPNRPGRRGFVELDHLEKEGVLEKVNSSEYATPIVPIVKANGISEFAGILNVH